MSKSNTGLVLWEPYDAITIPSNANSAEELVTFARQLGSKESRSIVRAFEDEDYEMMSSFVWSKAAAALKTQIATLGMDFVGEMLDRADIDEDSDPVTSIRDHEAVRLAEELGMADATETLRLRHAIDLVNHFAKPRGADDPDHSMHREEAISILRACIKSVLGLPRIEVAFQFREFRNRLESESFSSADPLVQNYANAPYFFRRTTLTVLLSLLKSAQGAHLEHVIGNVNLFLPAFWEHLKQPERWTTGRAYAELYAAGMQKAAVGLRNALQAVRGFDYVPETLRSTTFVAAAQKVIETHFAMNNFYNEPEPMRVLSQLGSTIPKPAFPVCMTASLCVQLGNEWGHCWDAEKYSLAVLKDLRKEQWTYFLNECLPSDTTIVSKLAYGGKPVTRWRSLVKDLELDGLEISSKRVRNVVDLSRDREHTKEAGWTLLTQAGK